jgi:LysR family transcriptional regulator AphB
MITNGMKYPKNGTMRAGGSGALDDLAVFALVAKHESFVEASRRAAIPRSSVSRAVARLEEDLGVRLLQRTTRKVAVTAEGRDLASRAALHLEGLQEALARAADRRAELSGLVRVTAPAYTGAARVAPALADFARRHPKVSVEIDPSNALRDLVEDGFDFGIRVGPIVDADFVARRLWRGKFGLFATRAFVRATMGGRKRVTRTMLESEPCVVTRPGVTWRFRDPNGQLLAIEPHARFAVNDPRAAVDVARRGGFVLAPLDAVTPDKDLVALATDFGEPEPVDLYVVYPTRRLQAPRVRMAIDWLFKSKYT